MTDLVRSPKPCSKWTTYELLAFNIEVQTVDAASFFGLTQLPDPPVSASLLDNERLPPGTLPGLTLGETRFLKHLASACLDDDESAVVGFATHLLMMMEYDYPSRVIRTRKKLSFDMGRCIDVKADVTVMKDDYCLLVAQANKHLSATDDPEPRLIAQSIAAFATNRSVRESEGLSPLPRQVVPGFTMVGTTPILYRTIATEPLLTALSDLSYPAEPTVVLKYVPPVPNMARYPRDGMLPLGNRRIVLQCFEAFKRVIGEDL